MTSFCVYQIFFFLLLRHFIAFTLAMSLRHILECDFLCSSGTCLDVYDARMYMLIPELSNLCNIHPLASHISH